MLQAVIRCSEHLKKSPIRAANDMVEEQNTTMIQLYVTHYKQAEHGASETMRQASFVLDISKPALGSTGSRRHGLRSASPVRQSNGTAITARSSSKGSSSSRLDPPPTCSKCGTGVTPRWWSDNIRKSMDHAGTKDISVVPETHQTSYSDDRLSRPLENGYAEISMGRDNGSLTEQRLLCHKCHWIQNQENGSLAVTTAPSMQKIRSSDTTVEHTITSGPLPNASDSRFGMVRGAGESMGSGVIIPSYYDPAPVMPVRDSGPLMVGISNAQRNAPSLDPPRPIGYPGPYVPDLRHRPMMRTDQAPGLNGAIPLPPPTMRSPIRPYAIPPMFLPFEADGPRPASSFNHILSPPPQGPVSRTNYEIHQPLPAVHVRNHSGGASASPSLANLVN